MLNSPQLEYMTSPRQTHNISKVTDTISNMRQKHKWNIVPTLNNNTVNNNENVINIQLNYNINQAMD